MSTSISELSEANCSDFSKEVLIRQFTPSKQSCPANQTVLVFTNHYEAVFKLHKYFRLHYTSNKVNKLDSATQTIAECDFPKLTHCGMFNTDRKLSIDLLDKVATHQIDSNYMYTVRYQVIDEPNHHVFLFNVPPSNPDTNTHKKTHNRDDSDYDSNEKGMKLKKLDTTNKEFPHNPAIGSSSGDTNSDSVDLENFLKEFNVTKHMLGITWSESKSNGRAKMIYIGGRMKLFENVNSGVFVKICWYQTGFQSENQHVMKYLLESSKTCNNISIIQHYEKKIISPKLATCLFGDFKDNVAYVTIANSYIPLLNHLGDNFDSIFQSFESKLKFIACLFKSVLNALEELHHLSVVHCDISISNLVVHPIEKERILLIDFNNSIMLGESGDNCKLKRQYTPSDEKMVGTVQHDYFSTGIAVGLIVYFMIKANYNSGESMKSAFLKLELRKISLFETVLEQMKELEKEHISTDLLQYIQIVKSLIGGTFTH